MLDKRLPYFNIIMRCDCDTVRAIAPAPLPQGYSLRHFRPGDEVAWARLETSVGEFDNEREAIDYFAGRYLPHGQALAERCLFITDAADNPVATATAWWDEADGTRWSSLHWVSVDPARQRQGLGSSVTAAAMALYPRLEPDTDVYLHTQTWSHTAVGIYLRAGFYPLKTERFAAYGNDYAQAADALDGVMRGELYSLFTHSAR